MSIPNLNAPEFHANRYAIYKELRKTEPVYWYDEMKSWLVFKHEDIMRLVKSDLVTTRYLVDEKINNMGSQDNSVNQIMNVIKTWMIYNEAPVHTRLRKFMNQVFFKEHIQKVKPVIKDLVLERSKNIPFNESFDFVKAYAHPIPAHILRNMIGLDEIPLSQFLKWSDSIAAFMQDFVVSPVPDVEISKDTAQNLIEMRQAFLASIALRKINKKDDLLSGLVTQLSDPDAAITEDELVNQLVHLIFGGHKIPQFVLSNAMHCLLTHPDVLKKLMSNRQEHMYAVIQEVMRFEAPIQFITRHATQDFELRGKKIRKDDSIYLMLGSGNRDEESFQNADEFNPFIANRKHISFGGGAHVCIGAALVNEELDEILSHFLGNISQVKAAYDINKPAWTINPTFHGLEKQPIAVYQVGESVVA